MRKPKKGRQPCNCLILACGFVIGVALIVELDVFLPNDPTAAVSVIILSATAATSATILLASALSRR